MHQKQPPAKMAVSVLSAALAAIGDSIKSISSKCLMYVSLIGFESMTDMCLKGCTMAENYGCSLPKLSAVGHKLDLDVLMLIFYIA